MNETELPRIDVDYCLALLLDLLAIPSPTGHTQAVMVRIEQELSRIGVTASRTPKGALLWTLAGQGGHERAITAHVDTLGAMVKEVKENGRLRLSAIGGFDWATVEGAECTVHLHGGGEISGTIVSPGQSVHVFGQGEREQIRRDPASWEVRLDIRSKSRKETESAGVGVGDFVSFVSGGLLTESGFVKGRHLDDKACVAVAIAVTAAALSSGRSLAGDTHFFLSNYEEVGHGGAHGIPAGTEELVCLDMAAVGSGQRSHEHSVTICVKDASGPYDPILGARLRELAARHSIPLEVDIYPNYRSDASAAWRAGYGFRAALVGPGVDSSHGYERTHRDALVATADLLMAYLFD